MAASLIHLSERAVQRIRGQMPDGEGETALRLAAQRLENGDFHYAMGFDGESRAGDLREVVEEIPVVVDAESTPLVRGMTVDFVEIEPGQERFIFLNPNDPAYIPPGDEPDGT